MQKESLIQSSRRRGPDVWEYRWRESCPGDKRKHRRIVIGSLDTLIGAHAAAIEAILVTHNTREFGRITGLRLEDWLNS